MHSSLPGVAAAFAAATLLLPPVDSSADTIAEVFARNREAVLASRHMVCDGVVFCVGRAISEECRGSSAGLGKAKSLAWRQVDRWLFETVGWPADASTEERRTAWALLPPRDISGGEAVFEEHPETDRWLVVIAIPETATAAAKPTPSALETALASARQRLASKPMPPPPAAEIDPGRQANEMTGRRDAEDDKTSYAEPRGLWEEDNVTVNETMAEGQF